MDLKVKPLLVLVGGDTCYNHSMIRLLLLLFITFPTWVRADTSGILLDPACYKYHKDGAAIIQVQQENDYEFGRKEEGDPINIVITYDIITSKYMWARQDKHLYKSDAVDGWLEHPEEEAGNQTVVFHPIPRCPGYLNVTLIEQRASMAAKIIPWVTVVTITLSIVVLILLFLVLVRVCHESRLLRQFAKWQRHRREYDLMQKTERLAVNEFIRSMNNIGEKQQMMFRHLFGQDNEDTVPIQLNQNVKNLNVSKPPKAATGTTFKPTPGKSEVTSSVTTPLLPPTKKDTEMPPPPPPEELRLATIDEEGKPA